MQKINKKINVNCVPNRKKSRNKFKILNDVEKLVLNVYCHFEEVLKVKRDFRATQFQFF